MTKPICIVQNWEAESPGYLATFLEDNQLPYNVVKNYANESLPIADDIEALIILGTPISALNYREHDNLVRLFALVSAAVRKDIPLLGICFGGQLVARVLGADVIRNDVRELGLYRVQLTDAGREDKLFTGLGTELDVFHWHSDTFMIPHGATLLATSETCTNQAFRKNNAVAVQFHIEPTIDEVPVWCDAYPEELAEEGLTKEGLVIVYREKADRMQQLSYHLMQNFLS